MFLSHILKVIQKCFHTAIYEKYACDRTRLDYPKYELKLRNDR